MLRTKIFGAMSAAVAAVALAAAPAMAQVPDVDLAAFTGTANASVEWVGGGGAFGFNSSACVGIDLTDNQTTSGTNCSANAGGTFTNVVCGTGIATGTATVNEADGEAHSVGFTIVFVAGAGVLVGTAPPAAGIVQISPTQLTPPNPAAGDLGLCTPGFTVTTLDALVG